LKNHAHETPNLLVGFDFISDGVWQRNPAPNPSTVLYPTPSSSKASSLYSDCPSVVLLFSWTGAHSKHIEKYTIGYSKLFPESRIIIVTTALPDLITRSSSSKQARLAAVIDTVHSHPNLQSVLIHCFSDGGSNKAVEFAEAYHRRTGDRLPCQALCLDSTPGHPRYFNYCAAFRKSLPPHPILRFFGLFLGYFVLAIWWTFYYTLIGVKNNVISRTRERLEDTQYWDIGIPRCYLYSENDELIWWKDIEEHGMQASRRGTPVLLVKFQKSMHCAHVRENEGAYWDAVMDTWELRDVISEV
jgi:hypothetical protein